MKAIRPETGGEGRPAALLVLLAAAAIAGCSRPDPITRACQQAASQFPLEHFSVRECVRCTRGGSDYMWFVDSGRWPSL